MNFIILGVIALFTTLNSLSYIVGFVQTPPWTIYLGNVFFTQDYFFYLSLISQGATRWLTTYFLFTGEVVPPQLIWWMYPLFGHLLLPLGLSPGIIYSIMVVIFSILYLVSAYALVTIVLPKERSIQTLAFVLFLISNAFPRILQESGRLIFGAFYPWYNFGEPFVRLTPVPSLLLIQSCLILSLYFACLWWRNHGSKRATFGLIATGIVLGSMQPLQWALVVATLGIVGLGHKPRVWVRSLVPACVMFVGGIAFAVYLTRLMTIPPYNSLVLWQKTNIESVSIWMFILYNGPLVFTAFIGLLVWLRTLTLESFALTLYILITLTLYFSPIPARFSLLNVRFLSVLPTLFLCVVSAKWIAHVTRSVSLHASAIRWGIAIFIMAITFPITTRQFVERNRFSPGDANTYLPIGAALAYKEAMHISTTDDVFLAFQPFTTTFSGVTGRRVFISFPWDTIDYAHKQALADAFYYGHMTDKEKRVFLKTYRITYVLSYTWNPSPYAPLTAEYRNDFMTIYKVPSL